MTANKQNLCTLMISQPPICLFEQNPIEYTSFRNLEFIFTLEGSKSGTLGPHRSRFQINDIFF